MRPAAGARRQLVIMARAPIMGQVKSRLARDIGAIAATAFHRNQLSRTARELGADRRWATCLAVTPDSTLDQPVWPVALAGIAQGQGDLGRRMDRIMHAVTPGPIVIVGCDIPRLGRAHVAAAFAALGQADAVFGPAGDGGYYLVGFKRIPRVPDIFRKVRWSSEHALADTLANCAGLEVAFIDRLDDIDTGADLEAWRSGG